jgi:hypothetical protein
MDVFAAGYKFRGLSHFPNCPGLPHGLAFALQFDVPGNVCKVLGTSHHPTFSLAMATLLAVVWSQLNNPRSGCSNNFGRPEAGSFDRK